MSWRNLHVLSTLIRNRYSDLLSQFKARRWRQVSKSDSWKRAEFVIFAFVVCILLPPPKQFSVLSWTRPMKSFQNLKNISLKCDLNSNRPTVWFYSSVTTGSSKSLQVEQKVFKEEKIHGGTETLKRHYGVTVLSESIYYFTEYSPDLII